MVDVGLVSQLQWLGGATSQKCFGPKNASGIAGNTMTAL